MSKIFLLLRLGMTLFLVLPTSCMTSRGSEVDEAHLKRGPMAVRVSELPGDRLRLTFAPVAPDLALEQVQPQEAWEVLASIHASFAKGQGRRFRLVRTSAEPESAEWEGQLRAEFVSRYGPPEVPLPRVLEMSPVFLALKLSPPYMGEGVRDAARELFRSPVFLTSAALSVLVYFSAWLAPEPLFTKAFVTALTLRLALLVGVLELNQFARACARLYREAEASRSVEELEAAAERFGKTVGGTGLRVLMLAASMGVARALPEVPQGGLETLLRAPRYALAGGMTVEGAATVQMVADGSIIVTGATVGTAASTVGSACTDGNQSQSDHHWHHLATNKNEISARYGGPWTPLFEKLFRKAGMSLDATENLVYLKGHKGPHPEEYHSEVYQRLEAALRKCQTAAQCRSNLVRALQKVADEVCTPGASLHQWVTKT